jgi:signal transduction histidine kinase
MNRLMSDARRPGDSSDWPIIRRKPPAGAETVAAEADEQLKVLAHELAGLVDGCMRYLSLAERAMVGPDVDAPGLAHVRAARTAIEHAAVLARAMSRPDLGGLTAQGIAKLARQPVAEAVRHAVEVQRPRCEERGIQLEVEIDPALDDGPTLPLYPVIANALRNAIEAVGITGRIDLRAFVEREGDHEAVVIEVMDDGPGPPGGPINPFARGYSTKEGGSGIGLALARDIAWELRGGALLTARDDGTPGARFVLRVPVPIRDDHEARSIGGEGANP